MTTWWTHTHRLCGTDSPMDTPRTRVAWAMRLKPGSETIYKQKHDQIWPEMLEIMRRQGIRNYSIYRHGLTLFAYFESERPALNDQPVDPLILRWWEMMEPYMECNPDGSPRQEQLEEMFYAD